MSPGPFEPSGDGLIRLEDVAMIVRDDVLSMTEAEMAAILRAIMAEGTLPVLRIVKSIIRDEVAARRALYPPPTPNSAV